jgi:hypothetical protein
VQSGGSLPPGTPDCNDSTIDVRGTVRRSLTPLDSSASASFGRCPSRRRRSAHGGVGAIDNATKPFIQGDAMDQPRRCIAYCRQQPAEVFISAAAVVFDGWRRRFHQRHLGERGGVRWHYEARSPRLRRRHRAQPLVRADVRTSRVDTNKSVRSEIRTAILILCLSICAEGGRMHDGRCLRDTT